MIKFAVGGQMNKKEIKQYLEQNGEGTSNAPFLLMLTQR